MFAWLKERFGRGSSVDQLIRALPNPGRIIAGADAWAQTTIEWGDRIAAWEPQESNLVDVIQATADALDVLGGLMGGKGAEKREALKAALRRAAASRSVAVMVRFACCIPQFFDV